jgi:putative tryptophan/tyrosine transport system substrate-binding protein
MRRRQFLALAGAAAAWPPVARAQHTGVPVVGYLSGGAQQAFAPAAVAFRRGLKEMSYVDGDNVAIAGGRRAITSGCLNWSRISSAARSP